MYSQSPYESWEQSKVDHRGDFTQNESYTRDQLSQQDYALHNNRVNRGPYENTRRVIATDMPQTPQYYGNTDRYGWADWVRNRTSQPSQLAPGLNEHGETRAPGADFQSNYFVRRGTAPGGCGSCRRHR